MTELAIIHDTFELKRTYPASPSRVFAAFASKEAKEAWGDTGDLTEPGADAGDTEFDFRVGGHERFGFGYQGVSYRYDACYYTSSRTSGSSTATRCTPTALVSPSPSPLSSSPRPQTGRR